MIRLCVLAWLIAAGIAFTPGPAKADWRDDLGAFRVGIVAEGNLRRAVARTEAFRLALEEALGVRVELFPARDYPALIDAAAGSRIEYAVLSASAYAMAWAMCECVEPMVIAQSGDGSAEFSQIVITRQDGAPDLGALDGQSVAAIGTKTAGGNLLALHELAQAGLDLDAEGAGLVAYDTNEEALAALAGGEAAAMIGWSSMRGEQAQGYTRGTLRHIVRREGSIDNYRIIWQSSTIPHRTHAIRKNLPAEAKTILRSLLTAMFDADPVAYDSIEPVFGGGFVAARQGQYGALVSMMRAKGIQPRAEN